MVLLIFETERDRAWAGVGAEKEGDTESKAGSRFRAVSTEPDTGLELTDREIMTWAEVRRLTAWAIQAPHSVIYFWERERERQSMSMGGAKRGRHRIRSRLQALSCQHRARRGARTHRPQNHDLSQSQPLNQLSHPGAPNLLIFRYQISLLIFSSTTHGFFF